MGKEAGLLDAARTGDVEYVRSYISRVRSSTSRPRSHKKRTIFQSHHTQSYKTGIIPNRGLGVNCCDLNGETPLHLATLNNHKAVVMLLLSGEAHVNVRDKQGCLPIHLAAWTGNAEICRALLSPLNVNDVNSQNKAGDTSLHIASQYGHTAVVRLLLQHEANPMIRNLKGESSLDLASFYGRLETVSLLINDQPALLHQMQHSHSPLHLASRNGQKDVVRKLLQSGYNINAKTKSGSALHDAATYGKVEVMKLLLQSGIDKSIKDKNNHTTQELLEKQNSAVADALLLVLKGEENHYHSLSPDSAQTSQKSTKPRLCKHGKAIRDITHQRRARERSSSGQTSESGSPTPTTPPLSRPSHSSNAERRSGRRRASSSSSQQSATNALPGLPAALAYNIADQHQSSRRCTCQHFKHKYHGNSSHQGTSSHQGVPLNQGFHSHQGISSNQGISSHHSHQHNTRTATSQGTAPSFSRHQSCPGPFQSGVNSSITNNVSALVDKERARHWSCQSSGSSGNYMKLSETTSSPPCASPDNRLYNIIVQGSTSSGADHVYDKMSKLSISEDEEEPVYDKVPKPFPIPVTDSIDNFAMSPLSPLFANKCSMNSSYESQDSVYNSPGSLSPELNGMSGRRYLGHVYVNLTNCRSTPDLNRFSCEAPKKPPRTETSASSDTNVTHSSGGKSRDYVSVDIDPNAISKSQEIINSNIFSSFQLSPSDRLVFSVPPHNNKTEQHFIFPPTASTLASQQEDEEEDDSHLYENVPAIIHQYKSKQPPKAMPRKSKTGIQALGLDKCNLRLTHPTTNAEQMSISDSKVEYRPSDDEGDRTGKSFEPYTDTLNNNLRAEEEQGQGGSSCAGRPVVYSTEL